MAEEMTEKPTEGTTPGGKYLTKDYLVRNLQKFWNKIKEYITDQIKDLTNKTYVSGAIDNAISGKADKTALETLTTEVNTKADESRVEELADFLEDKVDKDGDKVLSTNDFTDEDKTKLDSLTNEVATNSTRGLMSASDKAKLDNIAEEATRVIVDAEWNANSENPAQSKAISAELAKKADKENLNPSDLGDVLEPIHSDKGDIVLKISNTVSHIKIHTEKGELIEKFYLSDLNNSLIFNTLESGAERIITIPNPDGENNGMTTSRFFKFYVECLEILGSGKYKPFILKATRLANPGSLRLSFSEVKF